MLRIETSLVAGRSGLSPDELAEIAADGHTFASADWIRLLESTDLSRMIGSPCSLGFAITRENRRPVALVPLLLMRGRSRYAPYSIRRHYFETWVDELRRAHPLVQARFEKLVRSVRWYRTLLDASRAPLDDVLLVGSPMASRTQVAIAPSLSSSRSRIHRSMIGVLQKYARRQRLPLWFFGLAGQRSRWGDSLLEAGCQRSFLCFESVVDVEPFRRFGDYLQSFRRSTRRAIQREMTLAERLGIQIRHTDDVFDASHDIAYLETRSRLPSDDQALRPSREFFETLGRQLGSKAEAFLAERNDRSLGYHLILRNERRGELTSYRVSELPLADGKDRFAHSSLAFYEPIRRAIALGYRRVWLGSSQPHATYLRGARSVPIYSYFWFPRHWDRWCLNPYLQRFGEVTEARLRYAIERPTPWREALRRTARSHSQPG